MNSSWHIECAEIHVGSSLNYPSQLVSAKIQKKTHTNIHTQTINSLKYCPHTKASSYNTKILMLVCWTYQKKDEKDLFFSLHDKTNQVKWLIGIYYAGKMTAIKHSYKVKYDTLFLWYFCQTPVLSPKSRLQSWD